MGLLQMPYQHRQPLPAVAWFIDHDLGFVQGLLYCRVDALCQSEGGFYTTPSQPTSIKSRGDHTVLVMFRVPSIGEASVTEYPKNAKLSEFGLMGEDVGEPIRAGTFYRDVSRDEVHVCLIATDSFMLVVPVQNQLPDSVATPDLEQAELFAMDRPIRKPLAEPAPNRRIILPPRNQKG